MSLFTLKSLAALVILLTTLSAGYLPFYKRVKKGAYDSPVGEAFASGVFLGAGLIHMLSDSTHDFATLNYHYPISFLLAGLAFLFLLWLEHLGRDLYEHQGAKSQSFAVLATIMLAIHSIFAGAALGLCKDLAAMIVIFIAIMSHKWVASLSLSIQLNKSRLSLKSGLWCFAAFAVMTPLGVMMGNVLTKSLGAIPVVEPILTALSAGTFLYLGTLHGLSRAVMIDKCCNTKHYSFVILGFAVMALLAMHG